MQLFYATEFGSDCLLAFFLGGQRAAGEQRGCGECRRAGRQEGGSVTKDQDDEQDILKFLSYHSNCCVCACLEDEVSDQERKQTDVWWRRMSTGE